MNELTRWLVANAAALIGGAIGGAIVAVAYAALGGCP